MTTNQVFVSNQRFYFLKKIISLMDTWYLASLVTVLNWLGFLENFLASSSLQQFQVKSSKSGLEFYERLPPKFLKNETFCVHLMFQWSQRWSCLTSASMVWWHGYRDYKGFRKQLLWRSCSFWPAEALAKHRC